MKILKLKIGEIYKGGETVPVFKTFWEKLSKDKKTVYFEAKDVIFVQDVDDKPKIEDTKTNASQL